MPESTANGNSAERYDDASQQAGPSSAGEPVSDEAARRGLDEGNDEKIDRTLDDLDVSTTESGTDQSSKPDTEGSNSSSKNLDEQGD
jgi:hypothetical protein